MGSPSTWCIFQLSSFAFLSYCDCLSNDVFLLIFIALDRPDLEDKHRHWVRATLAYTLEIEDFDNLVDHRHLFDCYLGLEPSKYVLEKIHWEEKSKVVCLLVSKTPLSLLASSVFCLTAYFSSFFFFNLVEMATRYSKEKYARIRSLKNEPLSNFTADSKKRKLDEEKGETVSPPFVHIAPFLPLHR